MRVLRKGTTGTDVGRWQQFLRGQGFDVIVDDNFGNKTEAATMQYQKVNNLTADGVAGNKTLGTAMLAGFSYAEDDDLSKAGPNWPSPPSFKPLSLAERKSLFGDFRFVPSPSSGNPEGIKILDNWAQSNIVQVTIPQLEHVDYKPAHNSVSWNKHGVNQLIKLFKDWEEAGLMDRVLTWAGSWNPRFIRGSRTSLSNHCLPASEMVWTTEGPASIAELNGFKGNVWSFHNGVAVPGKVTNFFNNGKKPLLHIRAVGHEITCTPNHPILVLRKQTLPSKQWIQHTDGRGQIRALYWTEMVCAENIKPGDRIVATARIPEKKLYVDVDHNWAEILGLFLGDGCIHHLHGKPEYMSFSFPESDRVRNHVKALLTKFFGEPPKENSYALFYYKQHIWERFLAYDKPARMKELPSVVWAWSGAAKARLLLGLLYSDGTIAKSASSSGKGYSARYSFKFCSRTLTEGVRMLANSLGFRMSRISSIPEQKRIILGRECLSGEAYVVSGVDVHKVLIPSADPLYIDRVVNASATNKNTTQCWGYKTVGPDFTHHKVQGIEYVGDSEIFDIEVDKYHNFVTGGVVVSNSWGTAFDINVPWNGLGHEPARYGKKGCVRELVATANDNGFYWGGHFSSRPDGMHFELAKLI